MEKCEWWYRVITAAELCINTHSEILYRCGRIKGQCIQLRVVVVSGSMIINHFAAFLVLFFLEENFLPTNKS